MNPNYLRTVWVEDTFVLARLDGFSLVGNAVRFLTQAEASALAEALTSAFDGYFGVMEFDGYFYVTVPEGD